MVFANHHSVYPTVTRVNASSISTGAYPERHGLLGNTVFFPQVDASGFLDTSDRANLLKINTATEGHLLTSQTLGETLQAAGRRLLVVSAGSTGSAFLVNHTVAGGAILHVGYSLPDSLSPEVLAQVGAPTANAASDALDRRAVDLFLKVGLPKVDPSVTVILADRPGHDRARARYRRSGDRRVFAARGRRDQARAGWSCGGAVARRLRHLGDLGPRLLHAHGRSRSTGSAEGVCAGTLSDGTPRIVSGGDGAIYIRDHDPAAIAHLVTVPSKAQGRVGAIFTAPATRGSLDGWAPGTLSFDAIRWNHARSAEIMFSADWTDQPNPYGFKGTASADGVAGHGSASPFDVHNTLIAVGPDLKRAVVVTTPSVETSTSHRRCCRSLASPCRSSMQRRILSEAFATGPNAASLRECEPNTTRSRTRTNPIQRRPRFRLWTRRRRSYRCISIPRKRSRTKNLMIGRTFTPRSRRSRR